MQRLKINTSIKENKRIFLIHPEISSSHVEELKDCIGKLKTISEEHYPSFRILKMTVFINSKDFQEFNRLKLDLNELIKANPDLNDFPVLFVAQPPANEFNIAIELTALMLPIANYNCSYEKIGNRAVCKVDYGNYTELYGAIDSDIKDSVYQKASREFKELKLILDRNNLSFENIVRQWGYIGGITNYELRITNVGETNKRFFDSAQNDKMENYQMFNMARAEYYNNVDWKYGYPSATGIGANVEGCSVEFIATNERPDKVIIPLHNPKQSDAHKYTGKQFCKTENTAIDEQADTPKFERGKIVVSGDTLDLYVSGTAAIIGEDSIPGDIREQTKTTLDNISKLCSKENLEEHGLFIDGDLPLFSGVRAYIKYPKDALAVEKRCREVFGNVPILCVIADICRKELLVEIEAYLNCIIDLVSINDK